MTKKTRGQIFKEARLKMSLTQGEVAKKANINPNTYAKIERDEQTPQFSTIKSLATVLKINIKDIPSD